MRGGAGSWLVLALAAGAGPARAAEGVVDPLAGKSAAEVEVIQRNQKAACASPAGWVQVPFGNTMLIVRCEKTARASGAGAKPPAEPEQSKEGFQKARWGMTKAEVRKLYPQSRTRRHGNVLWYSGTVDGYRAVVSFHFTRDALSSVILSFHPPGGEAGEPECFQQLQSHLEGKYGAPAPGEDGHTWETGESRIRLTLDTAATLNRLTLTYLRKGSDVPEDSPASADPDEL